jgi:hypothetical protein
MSALNWWRNLSFAYKNLFWVCVVDLLLVLGGLFSIPALADLWITLTSFTPDLFRIVFLYWVQFLRGIGLTFASALFQSYTSGFLTLLCIHSIAALGIGFLFDHTKKNKYWTVVNYVVLIFIIFILHLMLILLRSSWFRPLS